MRKWEATGTVKGIFVVVHGAMEHHGRYGWLITMLQTSGYHVIAGDLPGQGLSTRSQRGHINSFNEYIEEVSIWVEEAMKEGVPIYLLGHSMGGLTVIRFLQETDYPIAGVILSSPCLGLAKYPPVPLNAISVGLNWIKPNLKIASNISIEDTSRDEDIIERALNDSLYVQKVSVRWYRELIKSMKLAFDKAGQLPNVPLLVMQGGDDKIVDKYAVRKWFNSLNTEERMYKEWRDCYHELFNEPEREDIFRFTEGFLQMQINK